MKNPIKALFNSNSTNKLKNNYKILENAKINFKYSKLDTENLDIAESYKVGYSNILITNDGRYIVKDPEISNLEIETLNNIINDLLYKLPSIEIGERRKFRELLAKFGVHDNKLAYFLEREIIGYGILDPILNDPKIEDVQFPSPNVPARVIHSEYGKLITNIILDEQELDLYIEKVVYKSGKSISMFKPMLSIRSSDTARITVTYKKEVGYKGSSLTIRKFPENPWSITRILCKNTLDTLSAAYLMTLIENKKAVLVIGGMGDGKTSLINSLTNFIPHNSTVITVEDSVSKDSIVAFKLDDIIIIDKIGNFVDQLFDIYNIEEDGFLSIPNLYVLTIDEQYRVTWARCQYLYRHFVAKEFVKIITETGKQIEVTGDHSLFSYDENKKIKPVKCSDLRLNDKILVIDNLYLGENYNLIYVNHSSLIGNNIYSIKNDIKEVINLRNHFIIDNCISQYNLNFERNNYYSIFRNIDELINYYFKIINNHIKEGSNTLVFNKENLNIYQYVIFMSLLLGIKIKTQIVKINDELYYHAHINSIQTEQYVPEKEKRKETKFDINEEKIVYIEKTYKKDRVYDLTVLNNGKFIANGFVCHNTPELRLAHPYWIPLVTRESITLDEKGSIDMFTLVKHALRMSGDYLIVGEVRGEEGRVWAQAIMTGHGGITSLHAETPISAIERLISDPIKVEIGSLSSLHSIVELHRISQYKQDTNTKRIPIYYRRVTGIYDLNYVTSNNEPKLIRISSYKSDEDRFKTLSIEEVVKTPTIVQIMEEKGWDEEKMYNDIEIKLRFINKIKEEAKKNDYFMDYRNISKLIWEFYKDPLKFNLEEIKSEEEVLLD